MIVDKTNIVNKYKLINDKNSQTVVKDFLWRTFIDKISDNTFLSSDNIHWQNMDIKWHKWSVNKYHICCSASHICFKQNSEERDQNKALELQQKIQKDKLRTGAAVEVDQNRELSTPPSLLPIAAPSPKTNQADETPDAE